MKATFWIPLATTLALTAACGGSEATSGTGATSAGAGGSTASGTTTGAGTSSSTSSGTGGADGDVVTLTLDAFTVPPGGEVYKCQNFKNPFGGANAEVTRFESHMTKGSHHLLLFYKKGVTEDGPLEDCSGLEFAATPFSTQLSDDELGFPEGVAALITPKQGLRLQTHYLNTTNETIDAKVQVKLHLAKPGTVTDHAGILFVVEPSINVQPNSTAVVEHECKLPFDMNLIKAASHMHKHGTKFTSTIAGSLVYETDTWNDPAPAIFSPPRAEKGGASLQFACTFKNDSSETLTFGESAKNNEMCIFVSAFYPVPSDDLTTIGCQ